MEHFNSSKEKISSYVITQRMLIYSILFIDTATYLSLFVAILFSQKIRVVALLISVASFVVSLVIWNIIEKIDIKVCKALGIKMTDANDKYSVAIQQLIPHKFVIMLGRKKEK